jgi:type I site-specific restriction-modification system R (restriction) subunit
MTDKAHAFDAEQIRAVVRATLEAENERRETTFDDVVMRAVATILTSFGVEEDDRVELRKDFEHMRRWRKSMEQAQSLTFRIVVTTLVTGFLGAVWLGIKAVLALKS